MDDDQLSGLFMISVNKNSLEEDTKFIGITIDRFGKKPRRLRLLFKNKCL